MISRRREKERKERSLSFKIIRLIYRYNKKACVQADVSYLKITLGHIRGLIKQLGKSNSIE